MILFMEIYIKFSISISLTSNLKNVVAIQLAIIITKEESATNLFDEIFALSDNISLKNDIYYALIRIGV